LTVKTTTPIAKATPKASGKTIALSQLIEPMRDAAKGTNPNAKAYPSLEIKQTVNWYKRPGSLKPPHRLMLEEIVEEVQLGKVKKRPANSGLFSRKSALRLSGFGEKVSSATPLFRIEVIRAGVETEMLSKLASQMGISNNALYELIRFPQSSATRLAAKKLPAPQAQTEIAVWIIMLAKLVEGFVEAGANENLNGEFNAYSWVYDFLTSNSPALGNVPPAEYLDTAEGRDIAKNLVQQMAYSVYA
jgi:Protein of unknown function (DUF2384)